MNTEHPVIVLLRTASIDDLAKRHGVYARWSTVNPKKCSLNYDQIEAKEGDGIVEHCRGLVVEQVHDGARGAPGEYRVLARPMRRFYNFGAAHAAQIDMSRAEFHVKHDGTLCIVYWDPTLQKVCVATRSVPDADLPTADGRTYADLFWDAAPPMGSAGIPQGCTLLFELIGPSNPHTVDYDVDTVVWLASIDNATGREWWPPAALVNFEEALRLNRERPATQHEGWIAVERQPDGRAKRVKIKSAAFIAAARAAAEGETDRGKVACILNGSADDVRSLLRPRQQERLDVLREGVAALLLDLDNAAGALRLRNPSRKEAAIELQASPLRGWLSVVLDVWTGVVPHAHAWFMRRADKTSGQLPASMLDKIASHIDSAP